MSPIATAITATAASPPPKPDTASPPDDVSSPTKPQGPLVEEVVRQVEVGPPRRPGVDRRRALPDELLARHAAVQLDVVRRVERAVHPEVARARVRGDAALLDHVRRRGDSCGTLAGDGSPAA